MRAGPAKRPTFLSFRNGVAVEESAGRLQHYGAGHEQIPPSGRNDKCTDGSRPLVPIVADAVA